MSKIIDWNSDFELFEVPRRCRKAIDFRQGVITEAEGLIQALQERASELQLFQEMLLISNSITVMTEYFETNVKSTVCRVNENNPFRKEIQHFAAIGCKNLYIDCTELYSNSLYYLSSCK